MAALVRDFERGALEPEPMEWPNLPETLTGAANRVVDDLRLMFGLRAAAMDDRPLPYACRWRSEVLGLSHETISQVLRVKGGGRGIGFGIAQALAKRGAVCVIVDLDEVVAEVGDATPQARAPISSLTLSPAWRRKERTCPRSRFEAKC